MTRTNTKSTTVAHNIKDAKANKHCVSTYKSLSAAKGQASRLNKKAEAENIPHIQYEATEQYGVYFLLVKNTKTPTKRGPTPNPIMDVPTLCKVVRHHAQEMVSSGKAESLLWAEILDEWEDEDIRMAMGRSKKPSGAIWAVEQFVAGVH